MSCEDMQVVVLMGGLGTRLSEYTKSCPKSLVEVQGKPFFSYQLELMVAQGFRKFLFLLGYRAEMIEEYFKDGSDYGVSITYCYDGEKPEKKLGELSRKEKLKEKPHKEVLLGTCGAVRQAYDLLEDDFLLMYGDSFMDIDFQETLYRYYRGKDMGRTALMTVLRNQNRFDKSNVILDEGTLLLYDKHNPRPEMEYIDYGIGVYEKQIFAQLEKDTFLDMAVIQNKLSLEGKMTAHVVTRRFYEIGSPDSLKEFSDYVEKRYLQKHPAVFFDRDGVINEIVYNEDTEQMDSPLKPEEFRLMKDVVSTLKEVSAAGYYIFIATNQPAAAKGKIALAGLYDINTRFMEEMKEQGIEIEEVLMCPHFPKAGRYTREDFLIRTCDCRKPKPGLFHRVQKKYQIDWENSFMVGDSYTDILAGKAAGLKTILLGGLKCDMCRQLEGNTPDHIISGLNELHKFI